jgi:hypothetical protein
LAGLNTNHQRSVDGCITHTPPPFPRFPSSNTDSLGRSRTRRLRARRYFSSRPPSAAALQAAVRSRPPRLTIPALRPVARWSRRSTSRTTRYRSAAPPPSYILQNATLAPSWSRRPRLSGHQGRPRKTQAPCTSRREERLANDGHPFWSCCDRSTSCVRLRLPRFLIPSDHTLSSPSAAVGTSPPESCGAFRVPASPRFFFPSPQSSCFAGDPAVDLQTLTRSAGLAARF